MNSKFLKSFLFVAFLMIGFNYSCAEVCGNWDSHLEENLTGCQEVSHINCQECTLCGAHLTLETVDIDLIVSNKTDIENNTYKVGSKISLNGNNYANQQKVQNYYGISKEATSETVDLSSAMHWLLQPLNDCEHHGEQHIFWHKGSIKDCPVRIDGEPICKQPKAYTTDKTLVEKYPDLYTMITWYQWEDFGGTEYRWTVKDGTKNWNVGGKEPYKYWVNADGQGSGDMYQWYTYPNGKRVKVHTYYPETGASVVSKAKNAALPLVKKRLNELVKTYEGSTLYYKNNKGVYVAYDGKSCNDIALTLNPHEPEYVHCSNGWNMGLCYADAIFTWKVSGERTDKSPLYGDITYDYSGFTVTNKSEVEYAGDKANWIIPDLEINKIILQDVKYDENKNAYGTITVTSTAPDGTKQSVIVKLPLEFRMEEQKSHVKADLEVDGNAFSGIEQNYTIYAEIGDKIQLINGTRCLTDLMADLDGDGTCTDGVSRTYNGVTIQFVGFTVDENVSEIKDYLIEPKTVEWADLETADAEYKNWESAEYQITATNSALQPDTETGLAYGEIKIIGLAAHGAECIKTFKVYFGKRPLEPEEVTIKINPSNEAGTVMVDYTPFEGEYTPGVPTTEQVEDGGKITVVKGTSVIIRSKPLGNFEYRDITSVDGNLFKGSERDKEKEEQRYQSQAIVQPTTFIVNFEQKPIPGDGYTLYVTSTEGGNAWVEDKRCEEGENKLGSQTYTVFPVQPEENFTLYYEVYEGYEFEKWEYRPRITSDEEFNEIENKDYDGYAEITMPYSDLTATAVFKKKNVEEPNNPERNTYDLRVTSNNELWGNAWAYVENEWVSFSEAAVGGEEYTVYFRANDGYYFTNWDYDSLQSPFITVNKESGYGTIRMPYNDLEIKAFFSPIPEPGENPDPEPPGEDDPTPPGDEPTPPGDEPTPPGDEPTLPEGSQHNIYFVSEIVGEEPCSGEGGTVPEDLVGVREGVHVTMAVTPYQGFEFAGWYFTKGDKHLTGEHDDEIRITPDNEFDEEYGSGKFTMTDYDIVAHALFRHSTGVGNVTVIVDGEGTASLNGNAVTSGTTYQFLMGTNIQLNATPADGWEFSNYKDGNGNEMSTSAEYNFRLQQNITVIVKFSPKGTYTLYISSMAGGEAWSDGNANHPLEERIVFYDEFGHPIYKFENVYAGEEFEIYYKITDMEFSFDKWDPQPYVEVEALNKDQSKAKIVMPYSDLTVTAVFKNDTIKFEPTLTVTSNNPEWGSAWVQTENGNKIKIEDAVAGQRYKVAYEANDNFYFIKWDYSITESPFVEPLEGEILELNEAMIVMPNKNLEIMAFFSPEPGSDDEEDGGDDNSYGRDIDFIAAPQEGGTIPQDLEDVMPGSQVDIGVTPNSGYEFEKWQFKAVKIVDEVRVERDIKPFVFEAREEDDIKWDGTGYFNMPVLEKDEHLEAIAVFKKVTPITYTLYVTYSTGGEAWTPGPNQEHLYEIQAIPGQLYKIEYSPKDSQPKFDLQWNQENELDPIKLPGAHLATEGYVIMPNSDMTVHVTFDIQLSGLKVVSNNYVWGNAWVTVENVDHSWIQEENGKVISIHPNPNKDALNLPAGNLYTVGYEASENCRFVGWGISNPGDANQYFESENVIRMPEHGLELVAYFTKENSGNTLILKTDPEKAGTIDGEEGIKTINNVKVLETIDVKLEVKPGYTFEGWYVEDTDELVSDKAGLGYEMPNKDVTLVAKCPEKDVLFIKKEGKGSGHVTGNNVDYVRENVREEFVEMQGQVTLTAHPDKTGSTFEYWIVDGETMYDKTITIDVQGGKEVIVYFAQEYQLTIHKIGEGYVRNVTTKEEYVKTENTTTVTVKIDENEFFVLNAIPDSKLAFEVKGWEEAGVLMLDTTYKVLMNADKEITVIFEKGYSIEGFKIASVRDLRWKEYFVDKGGNVIDRGLYIPKPEECGGDASTAVMLDTGRSEDNVKLGYAVEFELTTLGIAPENAVLLVKPTIYEDDGETPIGWDRITDKLVGGTDGIMEAAYMKNKKDFEHIVIFGNENKNGLESKTDYKTSYQTYVKKDSNATNNGVEVEKILWRWVYYLPADLEIEDYYKDSIVVRFDVELHEVTKPIKSFDNLNDSTLRKDVLIDEANSVTDPTKAWQGNVFKYSLTQSLLDDIYNNAT